MKSLNDQNIEKEKTQEACAPSVSPKTTLAKAGVTCTVIHGDSRDELSAFAGMVNLIVTSPPYADARRNHYDSIHPDKFAEWFLTFHEPFYNALKPTGNLVINIDTSGTPLKLSARRGGMRLMISLAQTQSYARVLADTLEGWLGILFPPGKMYPSVFQP
ncbi:DNA modification methylase [Candidatus Vecturithrix granuli]|uniref:site-specific DNA-methyltransferase (cytosine-N(4)-specific) n=1 Tax=Vecturithrix granuli TaxID=1499967 RepID=A0A081C4W0_VECG1|nr:DNA modification methylase [Candidatus Vecturithrix granuli]